MSFATPPSIVSRQRPPSSLRTHSSASSNSMSSSTSSISYASSAAHSSPQSGPITASSSKSQSAPHHHHHHQPAPRTPAATSPLLMLVHPHAPIHTPIPPSLRDRRPSAPNVLPLTAPLTLTSDEPWYDNAEFRTPSGTPTSAPCSACPSPLFHPRPVLPLRKSADSAAFPFYSQPH